MPSNLLTSGKLLPIRMPEDSVFEHAREVIRYEQVRSNSPLTSDFTGPWMALSAIPCMNSRVTASRTYFLSVVCDTAHF